MKTGFARLVQASILALTVAWGGFAAAQINISGSLSDGAGGPLLSGNVYVVNGSISVPTSMTLTVQSGAIVKFNPSTQCTVSGRLNVTGTPSSPVIFTSIQDDSAGGDTNNNGPSVGSAGDWRGIVFGGNSDASTLTNAELRFGGVSGFAAVEVTASDLTLSQCTIRDFASAGIDLNGNSAAPTITGCTIQRCAGIGIDNVVINSLAGMTNNAISNCGGNYIEVSNGNVISDLSISPANVPNGALVTTSTVTVPTTITLTLNAGAAIKCSGGQQFTINGTLIANGTSTNPVFVTSLADDTVFGDTNGDGPSTGTAGDWRGIVFGTNSDASVLRFMTVKFGGNSGFAAFEVTNSDLTIEDCTVSDNASAGLDLNNSSSALTLSRCAFTNNGGVAIDNLLIASLVGMTNNTATGNAGNYVELAGGSVTSDQTIVPANIPNGALFSLTNLNIPTTVTLTLAAGVALKMGGSQQITVNGTLIANGTGTNPVFITSHADDSVFGDTNNDGPSGGVKGSWRGIVFGANSDASALQHTELRYGGAAAFGGCEITNSDVSLRDCRIFEFAAAGLDFNNSASAATVERCRIDNCDGIAVDNMLINTVPGFKRNTASGSGRKYMEVFSNPSGALLEIGPENLIGGVIVFPSAFSVGAGRTLRFHQGVVAKMGGSTQISVSGSLELDGTAQEPVIFTSFSDDAFGGDTNNDGPSVGAKGDWRGLLYQSANDASSLENVLIRFAGANGFSGLFLGAAGVTARAVRVEHCQADGIQANRHAGAGVNWVTFDCDEGIVLTAGAFDVVHATSAVNTTDGIQKSTAYTGTIRNSISFGNGSNFTGFAAGDVFNSNGDATLAGANGNINADPLFQDPSIAVGNLRLNPGSPCLNTADVAVATATVKDFDENSRLLDHDFSGAMLPDMGAFERPGYFMVVAGLPLIDTTLPAAVLGPPGISIYVIGRLDFQALIPPFGFATVGNPATWIFVSGVVPVGQTFNVAIPNDTAIVGVVVGMQTLSIPNGNPAAGNITNLYRARIR